MGKGKRIRSSHSGKGFAAHAREVLTRNFQEQIRKSDLWPEMVAEFGEKQAEELLKQCRGELRSGVLHDASGDGAADI